MKKKVILSLGAIVGLGLVMASSQDASAASAKELYRLYNANSGEHFYTLSSSERDGLVKAGWNDEGIGWYTPEKGDTVYRLYNPNAGDHHYTENKGEYDNLVKIGWTGEGESFKSDTAKTVPIYRAYNPNATAGAHNFTPSKDEQTGLVAKGWDDEGIGFYGVNKEVVKDDLNKLINSVKSVNDNYKNYTVDSYAEFRVAFNKASEVAADDKATQADVDAAKAALEKANAGLERAAVENVKVALEKVVSNLDNQTYVDAKYTPEMFVEGTAAPYVAAVDTAKKVLADDKATDAQLTDAYYNLVEAAAALKKPFSNTDEYTNLDKAIKALATLKAENYTKITWDNLQAALPAAQEALKATEDTPENRAAAAKAFTELDNQYKALAFINTAKAYNDQFGKKADKYVYAEDQFATKADYDAYTMAADALAKDITAAELKGDKAATDALAAKEAALYTAVEKLSDNADKTGAEHKKALIDKDHAAEPTVAYADLTAFVAAQK